MSPGRVEDRVLYADKSQGMVDGYVNQQIHTSNQYISHPLHPASTSCQQARYIFLLI